MEDEYYLKFVPAIVTNKKRQRQERQADLKFPIGVTTRYIK